jgi:tyrosine-protein kinase Etk/Wzc
MSTEIAPLPGNLPASPLPFGHDSSGGGSGSANPLTRILAACKRFAWLIILLTIVGGVGGWLATRYMLPKYVVEGNLFLEARGGDAGPVEADPFLQGAQWLELINNPQVLDYVVVQQKLYIVGPNPGPGTPTREGPTGPDAVLFDDFAIQPNFVPGRYQISFAADGRSWELKLPSRPDLGDRGVVGDSAGRAAGLQWVPRPRQRMFGKEYDFTLLTPREVSKAVQGALETNIGRTRGSRFVTVSYDATDPERAARTLNAILERFVDQAARLKSVALVQNADVLDSQLLAAEMSMREADLALQNFKINTVTAPREEVPIAGGLQMTTNYTYGSYMQLRTVGDSLRRERRQLADLLDRARAGNLVVDQLTSIGIVRTSPQFMAAISQLGSEESKLRDMLGPGGLAGENKQVLRQQTAIAMLRDSTLQDLGRAVLTRVDAEIGDLDQRTALTAREMRDIPQRSLTEARLVNDLELAKKTHAQVRERAELARLQRASSLPDVRILNRAIAPLNPSKNRKMVIIVLGTLAGLGTGLGLAFLFDLLDKRFRYADQVTRGLGLSILGVVPEIRRAKGKGASAEEASQVVEAFRTIRLNLSHVFPETGSIALTITSPMPGDGKSLIASNLALSFAEAGYRTLLIDGDTRRGELHRTFGTQRRPGLLDHLAGDLKWEEATRSTSHPKLTLMPAGSRHRNAPELMGSRKMHELHALLREKYEVVIIDSPPLAAGIDPFVLGTVTGNLMLVVRAGSTERDLAEAKLQIVDRLPIRLVGAVLNDVNTSMQEYKYYAYNYSYGTTEEDEQLAQLPATIT